jgi:hypothetical protein
MANTFKVLGQSNPVVTTLTALYTVPASTQATVSTLTVTNRGGSGTALFRISIAVAGAADDPKQYIYYDVPINVNDTFAATLGLTIGATDIVRCYTNVATLSFALFGVEVT